MRIDKEYQDKYRKTHRKEFRKYSADYYRNNKSEIRKRQRLNYIKNRDRIAEHRMEKRLKRKYGIDTETYQKMLAEQDNRCAICRKDFLQKKKKVWNRNDEPTVDHCHKTGKVRGILCRRCNLLLSTIEDNNFVQKANQYLNKLVK